MVDRVNCNIPWVRLFCEYCLKNRAACLDSEATSSWTAREWSLNGHINTRLLKERYGENECPVMVGNGDVCTNVSLSSYLDFCFESVHHEEDDCDRYLKDWHFQASNGTSCYTPPMFLRSDWVNSESWTAEDDSPFGGDYRFVYVGRKGTWTRFHSDVLSSHSWSANVCGRKLWYFVPIGKEYLFKINGKLVEDIRTMENVWSQAGVTSVIQEEGELMFVPSDMYHQVHNLENTVSINHNSINGSNIIRVYHFLARRLSEVQRELSDVVGFTTEELSEQYQTVLFADARLNFPRFRRLLTLILESRSNDPQSQSLVCPDHLHDISKCFTSQDCIDRMSSICSCTDSYCTLCSSFLQSFDISMSIHCMHLIDSLEQSISFDKREAVNNNNNPNDVTYANS